MSKAYDYIKEHTRTKVNHLTENFPWITTNDAQKAVEIAREEVIEKMSEQKSIDKVEPKFKVGDTMRTLQEAANGYTDGMPVVISVDKEYYHCTNELIAIKDQDDYEFPPINVKHNPKEWSEEDKRKINRIYSILRQAADTHAFSTSCRLIGDKECIELQDFLKSLKDRVGCEANCTTMWKPSDEQIEALEHFVRSIGESGYASPYDNKTKLLYLLLEQLKKL